MQVKQWPCKGKLAKTLAILDFMMGGRVGRYVYSLHYIHATQLKFLHTVTTQQWYLFWEWLLKARKAALGGEHPETLMASNVEPAWGYGVEVKLCPSLSHWKVGENPKIGMEWFIKWSTHILWWPSNPAGSELRVLLMLQKSGFCSPVFWHR